MTDEEAARQAESRRGRRPHQHTMSNGLRVDAVRFSHIHPHEGDHTHRTVANHNSRSPIISLEPVYTDE